MSVPILKLGASGILALDNKVLLGLRSSDDEALPNLWCSPGGGVEPKEYIDQAIQREFIEETFLRVQVVGCRSSVQERFSERGHTVLIFREVFPLDGLEDLGAGDGFDKVDWFTRREVKRLMEQGKVTPMTCAALWDLFL